MYWLLNFITKDIGNIPGPSIVEIQNRHIGSDLLQQQEDLSRQVQKVKESLGSQTRQRDLLRDSTASLQTTMNQLLSIQEQSIKSNALLPEDTRLRLDESLKMFLDNQKQYQDFNEKIAELNTQSDLLDKQLRALTHAIDEQRTKANMEFSELYSRHRLKMAAFKLAVIIPLFLISSWIFLRKRSGLYAPLIYASFLTIFVKLAMIVHEYFPKEYFKYIALAVILGIVIRLLVYLLHGLAKPRISVVLRQRRQSYQKAACPICSTPILSVTTGLAESIRNRGKLMERQGGNEPAESSYSCPSCGTTLFGACSQCGRIRHLLLPFCRYCGNESSEWSC